MALLMPLPLTISCFSKIQIGFTFLVPAHPGSPGQGAVKRVCVEYAGFVIQVFDIESGSLKFTFGSAGEGNGQFGAPTGVAVDKQGNILVADWGNSRIQVSHTVCDYSYCCPVAVNILCNVSLCSSGAQLRKNLRLKLTLNRYASSKKL